MPTLQPGSTSQAFDVDIGQTVSVTPGSGGTMLVEYTTNSETDIRNGSATWLAWTAGTVSSATSDVAMFPLFARVTAYTAAGSYELSGSGLRAVPNQYLAWKSDVVSARDAVSATSLVAAAGASSSALSSAASLNAMVVGDSQLDRTFLKTATEDGLVGYGALNHANMAMGQAWEWATNADQAVIGDTCALVMARMAAIKAVQCDIRFLSLGTNDIWGSLLTADQTIDGLAEVFDALSDKPIIYIPITPRSFIDADKVGYALRVNRWAAAQQAVRKNLIVVERAVDAIIDPASTQFVAASGLLDGAVHWNNAGAVKIGAAVASRLSGLYPSRARLVASAADAYPTNNASNQLLPSPILSGTTGGKTATGGGTAPTGNVAAGFDVDHAVAGAGACACSIVARSDGIGSDQRLQISGAALNDRWVFRNTGNISAGVSAGEILQALADIRVSSHTNLNAITLFIQTQVDGGSINYFHALRNDANNVAYGADFVGGVQRTLNVAIPSGTTISALQVRVEIRFGTAGGAADVLIGRPTLWNLSRA